MDDFSNISEKSGKSKMLEGEQEKDASIGHNICKVCQGYFKHAFTEIVISNELFHLRNLSIVIHALTKKVHTCSLEDNSKSMNQKS